MVGTPGAPLDGTVAPLGGTWQASNNNLLFNNPTGVFQSTGGTVAYNDVVPPNANYWAQADFHANPADNLAGDYAFLGIHTDQTNFNEYYVAYDPSVPELQLGKAVGGVNTTIDTLAWNLDTAADGPATVQIGWNAGQLKWTVNGIDQGSFADTDLPLAGNVQIEMFHIPFASSTIIENVGATTGVLP